MLTATNEISVDALRLQQQMSRSSELAGSEIAFLDDMSKEMGAGRDFGAHMGRSSSEMSRQYLNGSRNTTNISSPRDVTSSVQSMDRSDSTNDNLNTPTQGFAPVFFTDRSPNSAIAAPKPVSGQTALRLSDPDAGCGAGALSDATPSDIAKRLSAEGMSRPENYDSAMNAEETGSVGEQKDLTTFSGQTTSLPNPIEATTASSKQNDVVQVTDDMQKLDLSSNKDTMQQTDQQNIRTEHSSDPTVVPLIDPISSSDADWPSKSTSISSPMGSSFSPLKTSAQHISSFFNYTTGFFRGTEKDKAFGAGVPGATSMPISVTSEDSPLNKISKNLPSFQFPSSLIPSAFSTSSSQSEVSTTSPSSTSTDTTQSQNQSHMSPSTFKDFRKMLGPPVSSKSIV